MIAPGSLSEGQSHACKRPRPGEDLDSMDASTEDLATAVMTQLDFTGLGLGDPALATLLAATQARQVLTLGAMDEEALKFAASIAEAEGRVSESSILQVHVRAMEAERRGVGGDAVAP